MSTLMPFLVLDQPCEQVLTWANQQLLGAGFRVVQTFNLQVARLAYPDCPCPHHETSACTCQMVVLLIYGKQEDPATLVIHGQDGRSCVSLAGPAGKRLNQHLEILVRRCLIPPISNLHSFTEIGYETRPTV